MERDVEMARAALSNAPGLSDEVIESPIAKLGEGPADDIAPLPVGSAEPVAEKVPSTETASLSGAGVVSAEDPLLGAPTAKEPAAVTPAMQDPVLASGAPETLPVPPVVEQAPASVPIPLPSGAEAVPTTPASGLGSAPSDIVTPASATTATKAAPVPAAAAAPAVPAASEATSVSETRRPNRLQLIDEEQHFHAQAFQKQLSDWGMADVGFGYDICAVLGSQSTGKSTLLNKLFGTNFDVMDERARQQTTKGIWLCRGMDRNVLVMDVEGTDGRERGEDQDFERKSALFALTTAECLIVNMWENQVGLYQGANMGLLKTVLDVNLSLFQAGRARAGASHDKTLLLFVIRDFIGATPLENLQATVLADLDRIWASLSKPANLAEAKLSDFFDVMFTTLPHKMLLAREFDMAVDALRTRFVDREDPNYVFQTQYHKRIPIDGLPHYLEGVWDQVVQNKDLDLPTQQELLAQFRCDEIAEAASSHFLTAVLALRKILDAGKVHPTLGSEMATHRGAALAAFDKDASRYHQGVYSKKRAELLSKLNTALLPSVLAQLKNLHSQLTQGFRSAVVDVIRNTSQYNFGQVVREQHESALRQFDETTHAMLLPDTDWSVAEERAQLETEIQAASVTLRADECKKMVTQVQREVRKGLAEPVELALSRPTPKMWDEVLGAYNRVMDDATAIYLQRATTFNCTPEEDAAGVHALQRVGWQQLMTKVHEQTAEAVLSLRLRANFEERFRYDQDGVPRVWKPTDDIDGVFVQARDATLRLIPLYARIAPTDAALLDKIKASEQDPAYLAAVRAGEEEPLEVEQSLQVLSELQSTDIGARFRKDADAFYVEAKRSTVSSMSQVPLWMYGVLIVLGWNEMMAVLRSPVYFTLLCMLLAGAYAVWRLNLSGPLLTVATSLTREVQTMVEDQLRAYLVPPAAAQVPPLRSEQHELQERRREPTAVAQ
ncbi:Dynamin-like GTPase that mediates homotypic ER fusion [Malassezia japonica]|uniref:Dynamin-like GTPase that mediates homotypic ER fusion n=1 Tax=Malassezia japonica TaxID=223818 RepID=A0AAF0JE53_9BASI|nr:Dynamin-like GTPase that mediates homotypic ER fusion [Malassezia japonica]WFD37561.1 Dynamin-like GTPase that mediates homotypic ER fusion [Malassezia japonica]